MKIFQCIDASANTSVRNNETWYRNLYYPLIDMGHEVISFDATQGRKAFNQKNKSLRLKFSELLLNKFLEEHKRKPFDLFFTYFIDGMIDPQIIRRISDLGVPTCNMSCNNAHQFNLVREISPYFDYNLHAERDVKDKFHAIGANPVWFPMASNPRFFKPINTPIAYDVSFVGGNYANRARIIHHLLSHEIDVHAFGPGWNGGASSAIRSIGKHYYYLIRCLLSFTASTQCKPSCELAEHDFRRMLSFRYPRNLHFPISDDQLIRLYSESYLTLGIIEVFSAHDPSGTMVQHLHLREFEAPMCGSLYCTGYTSELAQHFEPEKEVITYRNVFELIDKIQYYLSHPSEAKSIREAGRIRALAEHTYHHRFRKLFRDIGLLK